MYGLIGVGAGQRLPSSYPIPNPLMTGQQFPQPQQQGSLNFSSPNYPRNQTSMNNIPNYYNQQFNSSFTLPGANTQQQQSTTTFPFK